MSKLVAISELQWAPNVVDLISLEEEGETERACKTAEEFRPSIQPKIENIVSWEEFLLFLRLYPTGKKIAKNGSSSSFAAPTAFEGIQRGSDQETLIEALRRANLSPEKIRLFWEMLRYDSQNLYLKGDIHHDEALDNVYEMACNCKVDPKQFYQLLSAIHLVHSAPNQEQTGIFSLIWKPSLNLCRAEQEKTDQLVRSLLQAEEGERVFEECLSNVRGGEDVEEVAREFTKALPQLQSFLERMHKRMLHSTGHCEEGDRQRYREIKRGFRDILLAFHAKSLFKFSYFMEFMAALKNFRTDYLCRFSLDKVKRAIISEQRKREEQNQAQSEQGKRVFLECQEKIRAKEDPEEIKALISANGLTLVAYLKQRNKELLQRHPLQQKDIDEFNQLIADFKSILVYSTLVPSEDSFEEAKLLFTIAINPIVRKQIGPALDTLESQLKALAFGEISKELRGKIKDTKEVVVAEDHLLALFPFTFIHGTNSALLQNLPKTAFHLVSYGRLARSGVIPYSGELATGIEKNCINQFKISGTSLSKGKDACSYSEQFNREINEENFRGILDRFLKSIEAKLNGPLLLSSLYDDTSYWNRFSIGISRVRSLFPHLYQQYETRLKSAIDRMHTQWNKFKQSDANWAYMPHDRYGLCSPRFWQLLGYRSDDKQIMFGKAEHALENLKNALENDVIVVQEIPEDLRRPYPLLLASKTVHSMQLVRSQLQEFLAHKACLLGRDIQAIGVSKADRARAEIYLKKHGLEGRVELIEREDFEKAIKLTSFACNYFEDVASSRKIAKKSQ